MPTNMWPDFEDTKLPRSPKAVVEDAGKGLKDKTRGMVVFSADAARINGGEVVVAFNLFVPALIYQFPFMRIMFPLSTMYPVKVIADKLGEAVNILYEIVSKPRAK